ncbi:MAG: hypothetical protein JSV12_04180 [Candidatus Bathyarchaeota archaeon]|nr:MAG: hypothetical protein JSV12_04180 [Candidatus Bathyarchaeota archaeon]
MTDTSKELERLQKLRTELESRLAAIDDEHKTVEEDIIILREKVLIHELEKKMKEKGDAVAGLRIEKRELEDRMKNPNKFSEKKEPEDKTREPKRLSLSEAILKAKEEMENKKDTVEEEKEEPSSVFRKKDEQIPESDEKKEEPEKKKKLGIF